MDWMFWIGASLLVIALFCFCFCFGWCLWKRRGTSTASSLDELTELKKQISELEEDKAKETQMRQQIEEKVVGLENTNNSLTTTIQQLTTANGQLQNTNNQLQNTNNQLNSDYNALQTNYGAATRALEAEKGRVDALSRQHGRLEDAESRLESLKKTIAQLEAQKEDLAAKISNLAAKNDDLTAKNDDLLTKNNNLLTKNDDLTANLAQFKAVKLQLEEVKTRYAAAIQVDQGVGVVSFKFELNGKEKKLVELVGEIKEAYPELAVEFAKIEWNKVWLPQFQRVREKVGVRGIYRLVKVEEPSVCYVGQAVDIKTRWYTHCKKMVGAETAGGEWLYKCRPDELEWTVLEVVDKDVGLDEVERYWIEFFKANEVGLNRI